MFDTSLTPLPKVWTPIAVQVDTGFGLIWDDIDGAPFGASEAAEMRDLHEMLLTAQRRGEDGRMVLLAKAKAKKARGRG